MIRRFPSWLSACYFIAGFFTFGVAWLVWWLHAFLYYMLVTMPDKRRVRRALENVTVYVPEEEPTVAYSFSSSL